jgi:flagellar biosynthesis protein FliR
MATAVPVTVPPSAGVVIRTIAGVAVGVAATVVVALATTVGVAAAELVAVGVGLSLPTVTIFNAVPRTVPVGAYAVAEIRCDPLATDVEFQLKVEGGVEAK